MDVRSSCLKGWVLALKINLVYTCKCPSYENDSCGLGLYRHCRSATTGHWVQGWCLLGLVFGSMAGDKQKRGFLWLSQALRRRYR